MNKPSVKSLDFNSFRVGHGEKHRRNVVSSAIKAATPTKNTSQIIASTKRNDRNVRMKILCTKRFENPSECAITTTSKDSEIVSVIAHEVQAALRTHRHTGFNEVENLKRVENPVELLLEEKTFLAPALAVDKSDERTEVRWNTTGRPLKNPFTVISTDDEVWRSNETSKRAHQARLCGGKSGAFRTRYTAFVVSNTPAPHTAHSVALSGDKA